MSVTLLLHAATTWAMTGLIWFVQCVHYPLFPFADRARFASFHAEHSMRTTWVVGPLMVVEGATALALALAPSLGAPRVPAWLGVGLVLVAWGATAFASVPLHRSLSAGFDSRAAETLVLTNWIRTLTWTARAALVSWMIWRASRS